MDQPLAATLDRIGKFLNDQNISYRLIGGLAVGARAGSRATSNVNLIVDCEIEDAVKLLRPLKLAGFEPFLEKLSN